MIQITSTLPHQAKHAGIVFGQQHKHTIGTWVTFLELVHSIYAAEEMHDLVEYI
jgi:hypothetical protein